jgi:hypothetical protein
MQATCGEQDHVSKVHVRLKREMAKCGEMRGRSAGGVRIATGVKMIAPEVMRVPFPGVVRHYGSRMASGYTPRSKMQQGVA